MVSRSGHVVTNLHVVDFCDRIVIRGAVSPRYAKVIGRDVKHDLALLKVNTRGASVVGAFRGVSMPVSTGEEVVIVGYPGKAARRGKTVTRTAKITSTKGPKGEDTWIQLSDEIEQGNSGGPLMDIYGNVIGVIVAKAVVYTYQKSAPKDGIYTHSGVAIAAKIVRSFLDSYNVPYRLSAANSRLSAQRLTQYAHSYVVSVQCESATELR